MTNRRIVLEPLGESASLVPVYALCLMCRRTTEMAFIVIEEVTSVPDQSACSVCSWGGDYIPVAIYLQNVLQRVRAVRPAGIVRRSELEV